MTDLLIRPSRTLVGCIYGRNSSDKESSIASQLAEAREEAARLGVTIPDDLVYSDGISASWYGAKIRDEWGKVLDHVERRSFDLLFVWELSRADRSPETWARMIRRCREQGIKIHVLRGHKTLDPRDVDDLEKLLNAGNRNLIETVYISERTKDGISRMIERGAPTGRPLFGYTRTFEGDGKDRRCVGQALNDDAAAVREVYARVARGESLTSVVEWLVAEGYQTLSAQRAERVTSKPVKAAMWTTSHIRDLVRNKAYLGERTYTVIVETDDGRKIREKRTGKGNWPAAVDDVLWDAANEVLKSRATGRRPAAQKALLSSIPVCGECGSVLRASTRRGKRVYSCTSNKGCVVVPMVGLDEHVTDVILEIAARPETYQRLKQAGEKASAEVAEAQAEVARLERKLAEARQLWDDDKLTAAAYADMEARTAPKLAAARKKAEVARVHPALRQLVGGEMEDVAARWVAMPDPAKRDIIASFMKITVLAVGRGRKSIPMNKRVRIDPV